MKWFKVLKDPNKRPESGTRYSDWKEFLSIEGKEQCVYCSLNINTFGGIINFHVEHYKPKSKFEDLEHTLSNLFFACSICNCFKSDDWPNEHQDDHNNFSYPDPSKFDYSDIIYLKENFLLDSNYVTGKYLIEKLYLNRPQLILARRSFYLHKKLSDESDFISCLINNLPEDEKSGIIYSIMSEAIDTIKVIIEGLYINPYDESQIRR